ncbi:MAG: hypothetical protein EP326_15830 [Deltaproteobacteria bacterium]|nr:MAG: hypothetical protein EP326_15830 [Deltaproteobacteria bacterium]
MKSILLTIILLSSFNVYSQDSGRLDSVINEYMRRKERIENTENTQPKSNESQSSSELNNVSGEPAPVSMQDVVPVSPSVGTGSTSKSFFKVGVEPFKITRVDKNRNYGIDARTRLHGFGSYILDGKYNFELKDEKEPFSDNVITSRYYQADVALEKENFLWKLHLLIQAGFQRERSGNVFPIYQRVYGGVIGLKYLHEKSHGFLREFSVSYLPIYDKLKSDAYLADRVTLTRKDREYIRQFFQVDLMFALTQNLKASNHFHWRPVYDLQTDEFNANNSEIEQKFTLTMEMNKLFSLSYENKLTWNKRLQVDLNRPTTDLVNSFKLNWKLGL